MPSAAPTGAWGRGSGRPVSGLHEVTGARRPSGFCRTPTSQAEFGRKRWSDKPAGCFRRSPRCREGAWPGDQAPCPCHRVALWLAHMSSVRGGCCVRHAGQRRLRGSRLPESEARLLVLEGGSLTLTSAAFSEKSPESPRAGHTQRSTGTGPSSGKPPSNQTDSVK